MNHIFVIDDSISVRKALELSLKKEGMEVRSAASAEQAWSRWTRPLPIWSLQT
ncbi:hypothetical protein [Deinococcus radiophilus]|uniref:hypothetical protein n=1 Tax=Deinococcus radiophilus TaxID=32062 RepID=UPI003615FF9C